MNRLQTKLDLHSPKAFKTVSFRYVIACREIGRLFLMWTKNYVIWGPGYQGKNDVNQGQTNSTGMPSPKEVDKAE